MIQQLNPGPSLYQSFNKGMVDTYQPLLQRASQISQLQKALQPLQAPGFESQSYPQQLAQILPALLSTPGGAQLAGELAPVLNKRAENQSYLRYLDESKARRQEGKKPSISNATGENLGVKVEGPEGESGQYGFRNPSEQNIRNPQARTSPEATTPLQTMANQAAIPMTADQMQDEVENIMRQSGATGKPISYGDASQIVQQRQANILKQNELNENEKSNREAAFDKRMEAGLAQARNSGDIKEPSDEPIFKQFLEEGRNEKNSNEQYLQAKRKFDRFNQARDAIKRNVDAPNPITGFYRKYMGTYKDKEQILKDLQPYIKTYKDLGLIDPLRNDLATTVGLGPEDTETAIFPPSKEQRNEWNKVDKNNILPKSIEKFGKEYAEKNIPFPGEEFNLPDESFQKFKSGLADHLEKYPETNILALRGFMNQEKRISWQDISRAFNELIEEQRFKPDNIQSNELNFVQNPPIPGMAQMFRHMLTETK